MKSFRSNKRAKPMRRRFRRRFQRRARMANVPDRASLSETININSDTVGTVYNNSDIQLAMFDRATTVAQGYQYFRIKKLTYKYTPLLDTFASTGNTQVPYLYWVINKSGSRYPGINQPWFLANGAKLIRFDDKTITVKYAPAALLDVTEANTPAATQQPNFAKVSPWLNTTKDAYIVSGWAPSQVSHTGHYLLIDSLGSAVPITFETSLTAEFEFKKPNAIPTSTGGAPPVTTVRKER